MANEYQPRHSASQNRVGCTSRSCAPDHQHSEPTIYKLKAAAAKTNTVAAVSRLDH